MAQNKIKTADIVDGSVTFAKLQNVSATNKILGRSTDGAGVVEEIDCTPIGRALLAGEAASDCRSTLGLGTLATQNGTFSTIAVSGQSNVVADSATDTLTLAAGSNVTITTDASTDTITISASGGSSHTYSFLDDFDQKTINTDATGGYWTATTTGVGSGISQYSGFDNQAGVAILLTGAVSNSDAKLYGNEMLITTDMKPTVVLRAFADGDSGGYSLTQELALLGYTGDGNIISAINSGACFRYDATSSVGNWFAVTSGGSAETTTDTGISIDGSAAHNFRIVYESDTSVKFYIDGVLKATHTTNIPVSMAVVPLAYVKTKDANEKSIWLDYVKITSAVSRGTE